VKMNVLHFHLSEYQAFRVESKKFPKLQEMGSEVHYYTQDEIKELIAYARDRGISIIPEFDMPGHSTSLFVGYQELAVFGAAHRLQFTPRTLMSFWDASYE